MSITIDVFHFLRNRVTRTDEAEALEKEFYEFARPYKYWLQAIDEFVDHKNMKVIYVVNTYNYDSLLSQVLQYTVVEHDDDYYIFLQIHNGADVRGGYTDPRVFEVDVDYIVDSYEIEMICDCGSKPSTPYRIPAKYKHVTTEDDAYYICTECGKKVEIIPFDVW